MLNKYKKKVFLLGIASAQKKYVISFKRTITIIYTIIEDLALFLI